MRSVRVVVIGKDAEHTLEMATVHDQEPVEAFAANGADEALGDGVGLRRAHRCLDDLDALACEDGIEVARVLAASVSDQEPEPARPVLKCPGELARLLCNPSPGRVRGATG